MVRRTRILLAAAAALTLAGVTAGCSSSGDNAAPTTSSTIATTTTTEVQPADPPTVLDAGAEPREQLRITYTEGQERILQVTTDLEIEQTFSGTTQRIDSPPITQTISYTVGTVDETGADVSFEVTDVTVHDKGTGLSGNTVVAVRESLEPLIGLSGTMHVTPLGLSADTTIDIPDDVPASVGEMMEQLTDQLAAISPGLPNEAVGVGARWTTAATTTVNGVSSTAETTVTITEITDGIVHYETEVTTTAEPQEITEALPDGATGNLVSSELSGSGSGTLSLVAPEATVKSRLSGPQVLEITYDGETGTIRQDVDLATSTATDAG